MKFNDIAKFGMSIMLISSVSISFTGCSTLNNDESNYYLNSGSIVISKALPNTEEGIAKLDENDFEGMNQLLGYFPPTQEFTPAFNETWLELNKKSGYANLMQGNNVLEKIKIQGLSLTKEGYYFVNSKELEPVWLAPASYFENRGLSIPSDNSRVGAYGNMAIFTTGGLVLHNAPLWTKEVGGIKFSEKKLAKLFSNLPLGSQIIVK